MNEKEILRKFLKKEYLLELLEKHGFALKNGKDFVIPVNAKKSDYPKILKDLFELLAEEKADYWFKEHCKQSN